MRRSKRQLAEILRMHAQSELARAKEPTLANPALAMHTLYTFAVEHLDMFVDYVNEGVEEGEERVSQEHIETRLKMLHKPLDVAVAMEPISGIPDMVPPVSLHPMTYRRPEH